MGTSYRALQRRLYHGECIVGNSEYVAADSLTCVGGGVSTEYIAFFQGEGVVVRTSH